MLKQAYLDTYSIQSIIKFKITNQKEKIKINLTNICSFHSQFD